MISRLESVQERLLDADFILDLTRKHETTFTWLLSKGLIQDKLICPKCNKYDVKIETDKSKADLKRFRCPDRQCRKAISIRMGSIFESSKLTLMEYTRLAFHYFVKNISRSNVVKELSIDKNTVSDVYAHLREIISVSIKGEELSYKLGDVIEDPNDINLGVEVDESLFSHLDGNQVWVFGLYDRKTGEARAFVVENRTADSLIPIIVDHVVPGARIYTDGWLAYSSLSSHGFDHRVVNHSVGFGLGFFTTNHIESLWSELKYLTKHSQGNVVGSGEDKKMGIQHHIDVGIWRRNNKGKDLIEELIHLINLTYA